MSEAIQQDDVIPNGEAIVERFGGIRPMASKLNVPVTTVQGWKKRDAIPAIRRDEILSAAAQFQIDLKGLMPESANQNQRGNIPEDPALRAAPRPAAADSASTPASSASLPPRTEAQVKPTTAKPSASASVHASASAGYGPDALRQIRRTARRTSFLTTLGLMIVIGGAGFVLFGGPRPAPDMGAIEARMAQMAQQSNRAPATPTQNSGLVQQVDNLTTVIGTTAQGLAEMARGVTDGNSPILQRLAVIEQRLTQSGSALPPQLSTMAGQMESMAHSAQNSGDWQNAITELRNLVTTMQGQTQNLSAALEQAKSENGALGRQLQDVSAQDLGAAAMLLVLSELRESINRETPFAEDLNLLRQVAQGTDPELTASIDKLAPYAESGVLSSAGLKRALMDSANDIVTAKLKGEDVSMKEKIMGRIEGLFTIQKNGEAVAGGSAEHAIIQRASAQLDAGDVAGAMATLQTLDGAARTAAQPWETKAAATLAAQSLDTQLVQAITNRIRTGLSQLSGSGAGPIDLNRNTITPTTMPESATQVAPEIAPSVTPPVTPLAAPDTVEPQAGDASSAPAPTITIQQ
ncbi:MAG: hypothetical protein H6865_02610 [Rhodospirillales bacterium]|nr:hypothetical protein [Alphaproteobacteria bacterium]MCB9986508.1 hypothetical protein [Rhodospirillales bacterium]USO06951.1 MAG: hypothetical protein H6866_05775 [Rhodospirillales bacterium]